MDLTEKQEYELLAAISARGEIPVKFVYLGEGAARWDDVYKNEKYNAAVDSEEMSLMLRHMKSFLGVFQEFDGVNLIDLGCGNGLPAIEILGKLVDQDLKANYVAVDISRNMIDLARSNIKEQLPDIQFSEILIDFESESLTSQILDIKRRSGLPNLLINLGNTLGNYVNAGAVLTNFLQAMTLEDYLIVGNGLINDQNPQKILNTYDNIEPVKEAVIAVPKNLDLYRDEDDYRVLWNANQNRVEARIKLNTDREVSLANQVIHMKKSDEILVMQSHKYTETSLTKMLSEIGFRTELLTTTPNRNYVLAMVQPTRYSAS